jgi:creatinine amidohydrolase
MSEQDREVRFELLRPGELNDARSRCPLVFVPVGPLEYHGPHLPVGMDPINATQIALAACRRLGVGVVLPTLYWGTERERPGWVLESLGLDRDAWVVGMDFPTANWRSHYCQEHIFGQVMASTLDLLVSTGYKVIVIVNGHGALNQIATLERLANYYTRTTDCLVLWPVAFPKETGHADLYETSLMMFYEKMVFGDRRIVDLGTLPPRSTPIHYEDFAIVDVNGFTENPSPGRVVAPDPRDATELKGRQVFDETVDNLVHLVEEAIESKGIGPACS